jgi:diacylglycerol kinase family enzyme
MSVIHRYVSILQSYGTVYVTVCVRIPAPLLSTPPLLSYQPGALTCHVLNKRIMPSSTYNSHPSTFSFSTTEGLSVDPGAGDPPSVLPPDDLVCVLRTDTPNEYTLVHRISPSELVTTVISHPPELLLTRYLFSSLPVWLSSESADITIIVSTRSGSGAAVEFHSQILSPLCDILKLSPEVIPTTSASTISDTLSALSRRQKPQTVLLLAGDTAVHEAIHADISDSSIAPIFLALFPLGTGNALSSSYHTTRGISPLYALLFGTASLLPVFNATFSPGAKWLHSGEASRKVKGCVCFSWCFHASLVSDADALRGDGLGVERFAIAAQKNLQPDLHRYKGKISYRATGGEWKAIDRKEHAYALATMCSNLEASFKISPHSQPGDVNLRLVHFGPMDPGEVMEIMQGAYQGGKHVDDERVGYEVTKAVRIEVEETEERWRRICVDGGIVIVPNGGWGEVEVVDEPGRFRIIWVE